MPKIYRSFFKFDTSGITSTVGSATLKIKGNTLTTADVIALKCPHDFGFANADFDNITGWTTGSSNGSGGGDNESNVTKYSAEITTWSTSTNNITLISAALADMVSQDTFVVAVIEFDHDLKDITPTGSNVAGAFFADSSTASNRPVLDYTLAPPADNSIFFGTNF